jgi:hypothetical protein
MTRRSIPEDIADMLNEADPDGITDPSLVIVIVANDNKESFDTINNVVSWIKKHALDNIRLLLVDSIDSRSIWGKLRVYDTKKAPKMYVFNKGLSLIDVYSGVVSVEFLDSFTYSLIT